jgi:hypothetical protein
MQHLQATWLKLVGRVKKAMAIMVDRCTYYFLGC